MLFESLFRNAQRQGDHIAVIDDRGQHSYQQLAGMSAGMGMYLADATTRPAVGLLLPASAGFAASFYGTLLAGKSVVPINFLLGDREIAHVIADSGIDTVVTIPMFASRLKDTPLKIIDLTALPPTPATAITPKFPEPKSDDVAVLLYTSGTSGLPKGVMLTYNNLQSDVDACIAHAQLQHQHNFLGIVPLFHAFGLTATMLAPVQLGSTIVYTGRFSAVATMEAIRKHAISLVFGVPSMLGALMHLKSASADDFRNIYAVISGGEPLPAALREAFLQRFGRPILEGYGLTETSPVVALNTPQEHRPGSVGKPVPGVEVRVVDENDQPLPPGEIGELWFKGPMVLKGYHNLPEETARVLTADGFFKTGDLGKVDADGFIHITGRKKEMIIVAGEKVFPREVEEILIRHPGVLEAAVVGRKDPGRGEVVVAFVMPKPETTLTPEVLRDHCRELGLPNWKCPREIHIVPDLPRSPTGKVLKRVLIETLAGQ
jgi:long-chain acyl-CoA synthetase